MLQALERFDEEYLPQPSLDLTISAIRHAKYAGLALPLLGCKAFFEETVGISIFAWRSAFRELLLAVIIEHGDVGDIVDTLARDEVRGIVEFVAVELDELIHWHLFPRWGRRTSSGDAGVTGCVSRKVRVDRRRTY